MRLRLFLRCCVPWLLCTTASDPATAQDTLNSPVFKRYRAPGPSSLVEQSDATYRMWQTFQVIRQANRGDPGAQHELGVRYLIGRGVTADTAKGAYWTQKAADQNMAPARFNLGILLERGWGIGWNPFAAYDQFVLAAQRGMPEAQSAIGYMLTDNLVVARNWKDAYRWMKAAADSGYEPALEALPEFRKRAYGDDSVAVPETGVTATAPPSLQWTPVQLDFSSDSAGEVDDRTLLADLLREASPDLQRALGTITPDSSLNIDSVALQSLQRAANAGSPEALSLLGRCYEKGIGAGKDPVGAVAAYVRAVRSEAPHARGLLQDLLEQQPVIVALRVGAAQNREEAMFGLAALAALGLQYPLLKGNAWVTDEQALALLTSAARRGHIPAMIELGLCYFSGRWVDQNSERAFALWEDAAARGSVDAEVRLAASRALGRTGHPDSVVQTLDRGCGEGSVLARMALGYCYEQGFGVERNMGAAARQYRAAATRGSQDAYRALVRIHDALRPQEPRFRVDG